MPFLLKKEKYPAWRQPSEWNGSSVKFFCYFRWVGEERRSYQFHVIYYGPCWSWDMKHNKVQSIKRSPFYVGLIWKSCYAFIFKPRSKVLKISWTDTFSKQAFTSFISLPIKLQMLNFYFLNLFLCVGFPAEGFTAFWSRWSPFHGRIAFQYVFRNILSKKGFLETQEDTVDWISYNPWSCSICVNLLKTFLLYFI